MTFDWNRTLNAQLEDHWTRQLRPRLAGLTDGEYFWEPAPGAWNVRRREDPSPAPMRGGGGAFTSDFAVPEPDPPPVTTIAWRLCHLLGVVPGMRAVTRFAGPPVDFTTMELPGTAAEALTRLDDVVATWIAGVRDLGDAGLAEPAGPDDTPYGAWSTAAIVLHVQREFLHHGAEIALLRDLYRARGAQSFASTS